MNTDIDKQIEKLEQEKRKLISNKLSDEKEKAENWAKKFLNLCYRTKFSANYHEGTMSFGKITDYRLENDNGHWAVVFNGQTLIVSLSYYNIEQPLFNREAYSGILYSTFVKSKKSMQRDRDGSEISKAFKYDFLSSDVQFVSNNKIWPSDSNEEYIWKHFERITEDDYKEVLAFVDENSSRVYSWFDKFLDGERFYTVNKKIQTKELDIPHINVTGAEISWFTPELSRFVTRLGQYIITENSVVVLQAYLNKAIEKEHRWSSFGTKHNKLTELYDLQSKLNEAKIALNKEKL